MTLNLTAPMVKQQKTKMVEHNSIHRKLAQGRLGVLVAVKERERKESNTTAEKMLTYLEHSPVLGYRGCWTEAARGCCCRCPVALRPPSAATAGQ